MWEGTYRNIYPLQRIRKSHNTNETVYPEITKYRKVDAGKVI